MCQHLLSHEHIPNVDSKPRTANGLLILGFNNDSEGPPISARQARRPLTIETPESILKVCSSAQVSSSTGPSSADDVPTVECEQAPPPAPVHPSPQTVVDYIGAPPCGTSIQLFKSSTVDSDYGSLALEKIVTVAVSSAVPSCLLLLTTKAALLKIQTFIFAIICKKISYKTFYNE